MHYLSCLAISCILAISCTQIYSETIPAKIINPQQVDQSFILWLDGGNIAGKTLEEVCDAIGLPPSDVPGGYWCGPLSRPTYVGRLLICSDGSIKIAGRETCENPAVPTCPNGFWTLDTEKNTCSRPDFSCIIDTDLVSEEKLLAAIAYGESSTRDSYEEMAGIAYATLRRRDAAHMPSVQALIKKYKSFTYVIIDGNPRYRRLMCSETSELFDKAYQAAKNALEKGFDYANGGCFWDGYDLKTSGLHHRKYLDGFKFTDQKHNILDVQEPPPYEKITKRGSYSHLYDSTAAYGGTIFWKLNKDYLKAKEAGQCL